MYIDGGVYLFQVGDKVFYPMHGAGTVKAIENIEFQGKKHRYYVINIPISKMDVKIPCDNAVRLHIRSAVAKDKVDGILRTKHAPKKLKAANTWTERLKAYSEKMKTGDMESTFAVVRNLVSLSEEKSLNATERDMLNNARKLLISELALIKDIPESQAAELLDKTS